jgi:hypothetical protein
MTKTAPGVITTPVGAMVGGGMLFVCLGIDIAVVWSLVRWARWVGSLYGAPNWCRLVPWAILLVCVGGNAIAVYGLLRAFAMSADATGTVDPTQKARILAEGISEAMNGAAYAMLGVLGTVVCLLVLTARYSWLARKPGVPNEPPYR